MNKETLEQEREIKKYLLIIEETEKAFEYIRTKLKPVYARCRNTSTIEQSNRIYKKELQRIINEAFQRTDWSVRPHVIYKINNAYKQSL